MTHPASDRLHISARLGVDHVVAAAGVPQCEKVEPNLRSGGAEPSEVLSQIQLSGAESKTISETVSSV
jgi:hypothetical protein